MTEVALRPFSDSGYEILDEAITAGEVTIWSVAPLMPKPGDLLLIESRGRPYDATVEDVTLVRGGWSARCRATPA